MAYPTDCRVLRASEYLVEYPFADRLFPAALDVVRSVGRWGTPVIFSDGDAVFQPRKVSRSGSGSAVGGRVLIYAHKERELADVERRYPAGHVILVDDKLRILSAVKAIRGPRVTTVFPRQGHYAHDPETVRTYPPADVTARRIADLLEYDPDRLRAAATRARRWATGNPGRRIPSAIGRRPEEAASHEPPGGQ
jgi:hypothetical protein